MTGRRLAAVAAAALMIVLAVFVRSQLDDDSDGAMQTGGGDLTIACIPELTDVCNRLEGVEVVGEDAADPDGWVTVDGVPLHDGAAGDPIRLASTPLVIAMVKERVAALNPACGGAVNWRCLFDSVGRAWDGLGGKADWGTLRVGLPPRSSAIGLLVVTEAVAGFVGQSEFATNDLDFDDAFGPWFARVRSAETPDPLGRFVQTFPAAFSAIGTTEAETKNELGRVADRTEVIVPTPTVNAVALLVQARDGDEIDGLADSLRDALHAAGWTGAADAPTGLPDPGVLVNLRDR